MLPKLGIAARLFTITFFFAIRIAPRARVIVVIIGRNSGVRPTARATANMSDWSGGRWKPSIATSVKPMRSRTIRVMRPPKVRRPRSNSVSGGFSARRAAMPPRAVWAPVFSTRIVAVPLTTEVPRDTRPSSPWPTVFSAGIDSPVRAAS